MSEKVTVTVNEGKIRGLKTKTAYSGTEYYSFLGVPYGQSPAGVGRFKDPVKVKPWNSILDATVAKEGCYQFSLMKKCIVGSEDCLYNNIYTPKLPSEGDSLKAVIVSIHPGGMFHGSPDPDYYGSPEYIMHRDIVYVCMGYRLHILGLLNLNTKNCTGNQAIKDIILSLKWIKENIHVFGGDPENITLMGSSSGSAYVHLLLLSPLAKGLFHKAILAGMYILNPLLIHSQDYILTAYELAKDMGYNGELGENKKLLNFYRKLDFIRFITARSEKYLSQSTLRAFPASPYIPTVDPTENSPIPISPDKLAPSTNRVPIIIGFCEKEAAMGVAFFPSNQSIADVFHTAISQNCWGWGADLNTDEQKQIQKEVEDFYLGGQSIETASKPLLCDIITDAGLSDVYDSLINVISEDVSSPVYVYNFHYDGKLDWGKKMIKESSKLEMQGASHAADFGYWCYMEMVAGKQMTQINPNDREMIETYVNLMTTFAKTSNPNYKGIGVNWKPSNPKNPSHLIINEQLKVENELLNGARMEFWHKLKRKFKK
ncbi:esterase E4-like [Planococcus citri]|uniref:esterase E4-like n=1 Tax=Planococcus citri TaxID=170843 RepID=UPI0031F76447